MAASEFSELVSRLLEAMGQQMDAVRPVPEGLLLRTGDRFVFAFLEDPDRVSLAFVQSLLQEVVPTPTRLVVLSKGHLPPALDAELERAGATVVQAGRFHELVRGLGLGTYLGEEPRAAPPPPTRRLLPSAQQLDEIMRRGKTWLDWGVPALALRFYRQAATMKPEFAPARVGIGRSLLALQLAEDADKAFAEALEAQPDDLEARLGRAAVLGARGHVPAEVAVYRGLIEENPARVAVRSHLVAALVSEQHWSEALTEIDALLASAPEDPQLRFLRSGAMRHLGDAAGADAERDRARRLGLPPERERALCEHLRLPAPEFPAEAQGAAVPAPTTVGSRGPATSKARRSTPGRSRSPAGSASARATRKPRAARARKPK